MFFIKSEKIFYKNNQTEKYLCHIRLCHFLPVISSPIFVKLESFVFPLELQTFDLNGIRDLSIGMIRSDRENFL